MGMKLPRYRTRADDYATRTGDRADVCLTCPGWLYEAALSCRR